MFKYIIPFVFVCFLFTSAYGFDVPYDPKPIGDEIFEVNCESGNSTLNVPPGTYIVFIKPSAKMNYRFTTGTVDGTWYFMDEDDGGFIISKSQAEGFNFKGGGGSTPTYVPVTYFSK